MRSDQQRRLRYFKFNLKHVSRVYMGLVRHCHKKFNMGDIADTDPSRVNVNALKKWISKVI